MLETAWFYKYRPKEIEDYVFENEDQKLQVLNWIKSEKIPGNLLLSGPPGVGKTALIEVILKKIIKNSQDLNRVKDRSVTNIDDLQSWIIKPPLKSKSKVIYFEEFDKLSSQAMSQLKDGMLEKFQEHVTFIATTNYINKIDKALVTRFNLKYNLTCTNLEGIFNRLKTILDSENIKSSDEDLAKYIETNKNIGMRDLINNMQIACSSGSFDISSINIERSVQEEEVYTNTLMIFETIFSCRDLNSKKLMLISPIKSEISIPYVRILEIINMNKSLRYELILEMINENVNFLPLKFIIDKYIDVFSYRRFPNITYLSFLYESIKTILDINL